MTEPISTADREKAKDMLDLPDKELEVMRELSIKDQWLVPSDTRRLIQEIRAQRARVVELEATLKAAEDHGETMHAANKRLIATLVASEARATAAEAALRVFADRLPANWQRGNTYTLVPVDDLVAARAVLADRPQEGTQE